MKILYADDEPHGRTVISNFLEAQLGHEVVQCQTGRQALDCFLGEHFRFVLTDIRMPEMDGLELLKQIKSLPEGSDTDIVLITAFGDMSTAVSALREGAYDYLNKPVDLDELTAVVSRVEEHQRLLRENYDLTHHLEERVAEATRETRSRLERLQNVYAEITGIGTVGIFSGKMKELTALASTYHEDKFIPVMIEGETGTGKEVFARMVHYGESAGREPFIPINCSAIAPTLFESELFGYEPGSFTGASQKGHVGKLELAGEGTIFLDEIGDMPLEMQPKLLRVLQERDFYRVGGEKKIEMKARIICASNRNLQEMTEKGRFRKDLYYRFSIGRLYIPPLRERRDEIFPLANMFLHRYSRQRKRRFRSISPEAAELLKSYHWPGNVRELQNTIERVVLIHDAPSLEVSHISFLSSGQKAGSDEQSPRKSSSVVISLPDEQFDLGRAEYDIIRKVINKFSGNKTRAAQYLGITRTTLRSKLTKYGQEQ